MLQCTRSNNTMKAQRDQHVQCITSNPNTSNPTTTHQVITMQHQPYKLSPSSRKRNSFQSAGRGAGEDDSMSYFFVSPTTSSPSGTITSSLHSQESVMASDDWSSEEVRAREATVFLSLVQISERSVGSRFVQPFGHTLEDLCASLG
jgi:hypothetical protein